MHGPQELVPKKAWPVEVPPVCRVSVNQLAYGTAPANNHCLQSLALLKHALC